MVKLIARRLALGVLTILLVSGIIFVGVQALPGDSCTAYLGRAAQGKRLDNCRRDFGLERPALTRYVTKKKLKKKQIRPGKKKLTNKKTTK
jgi:peptide/nickel transport system permease protein